MSEDSSTASNADAGTVSSSAIRESGQRESWVPWKNQLLPLSARIRPSCYVASMTASNVPTM